MSIASTLIMGLLLVSEFYSYIETKTGSEMFIDVNRGGDKVFIYPNL